jgi:hypothetical protein
MESTGKIAVGVGFGRVISHNAYCTTFDVAFEIPSLVEILVKFWKPTFWMYGHWMTLGDAGSITIGEQTRSQQENVALVSALWLTIQFSFMYSFPDVWDDISKTSYIAQAIGAEQSTFAHEFLVAICLTSCSANTVACVYSVLVILITGEMNSSVELDYLQQRMGRLTYIAFPLLCLSITLWSVKSLIYQVMLCQTLTGVILTTVPPCLLMGLLVGLAGNIIRHAYEVKFIAGLKRPTKPASSALWSSPLFADYAQCQMLLERFGRECGFRNLSEATFTEYVSIFMRTEELTRIKAAYPELVDNSPELSAVRVLDICELSRAWAKEVVGKKMDNLKIETDPGQLVMSDVE